MAIPFDLADGLNLPKTLLTDLTDFKACNVIPSQVLPAQPRAVTSSRWNPVDI